MLPRFVQCLLNYDAATFHYSSYTQHAMRVPGCRLWRHKMRFERLANTYITATIFEY